MNAVGVRMGGPAAVTLKGADMTFFAGLDLGLNETAVCVIDGEGTIVGEAEDAAHGLFG